MSQKINIGQQQRVTCVCRNKESNAQKDKNSKRATKDSNLKIVGIEGWKGKGRVNSNYSRIKKKKQNIPIELGMNEIQWEYFLIG